MRTSPTYRYRIRSVGMRLGDWLLDEADNRIGPFTSIEVLEDWVRCNGGGYIDFGPTTMRYGFRPPADQGLLFRRFNGIGFIAYNDPANRRAFNDGRDDWQWRGLCEDPRQNEKQLPNTMAKDDDQPCTRCGGSGKDPLYKGVCQKCGGDGKE